MVKVVKAIAKEDFESLRIALLVGSIFPVMAHALPTILKWVILGCALSMPLIAVVNFALAMERRRNENIILCLGCLVSFGFNLLIGFELMY